MVVLTIQDCSRWETVDVACTRWDWGWMLVCVPKGSWRWWNTRWFRKEDSNTSDVSSVLPIIIFYVLVRGKMLITMPFFVRRTMVAWSSSSFMMFCGATLTSNLWRGNKYLTITITLYECGGVSQSASQSVSQSLSQSVSQSVSQLVSHSVS